MYRIKKIKLFFVIMIIIRVIPSYGTDQELAIKLKNELEFDTNRINDFKNQKQAKKVYEHEREKSLSLFLEEQEKWDITREKGLKEQRLSRQKNKDMDEQSPEYIQDLKEKKKYEQDIEISRKKHNETKKQIEQFFAKKTNISESEELDVYNDRPRFNVRKRGQNKWVNNSKSGGASTAGSSGGISSGNSGVGGASPPSFDYQPPPMNGGEYMPVENFDDLPPPPPLLPYDGYGNPGQNGGQPFDNGTDFVPPQGNGIYPPPPDGGWDF